MDDVSQSKSIRLQDEEALAEAFKSAFNQGIIQQLGTDFSSESESIKAFSNKVSTILIDYCSFKIGNSSGMSVNPFDDPFVGAALLTANGILIGAHRKEEQGERHAEPQAIVSALQRINTSDSLLLIERIEAAYGNKSWLISLDQRDLFLKLFSEARRLISEYSRLTFKTDKLIFVSTLEPCRDFESNPSCATIISNFKPDLVIYGCDDTNLKGQGKPIIMQHGIKVIPNASPEENISINKLFFSAVAFIQKLHNAATERNNSFGVFYSIVNLSQITPSVFNIGDRIGIKFKENDITIRHAQVDPRVKSKLPYKLPESELIDVDRILFINQLNPDFICLYLHHCNKHSVPFPAKIICSQSGGSNDETRRFIEELGMKKIKLYENAFRMTDERYLASQLIFRNADLYYLEQFYLSIKTEIGYQIIIGKLPQCLLELKKFQQSNTKQELPIKIELFVSILMEKDTKKLIDALEGTQLLLSEAFAKTSFRINICASTEDNLGGITNNLREHIDQKNLSHRFTVQNIEFVNYISKAEQLYFDTLSGNFDPVTIHNKIYEKIVNSSDWQERLHAGLLISEACNQDSTLRRNFIVEKLPFKYSADKWKKYCTLFNAIAKIDWKTNNAYVTDLIQKLDAITEKMYSDPAVFRNVETIDISWRLISATFALCKFNSSSLSIIKKSELNEFISSNLFLIKELLYYALKKMPHDSGIVSHVVDTAKVGFFKLCHKERCQLVLRLARMASMLGEEKRIIVLMFIDFRDETFAEFRDIYLKELSLARQILSTGLEFVFSLAPEEKYDAFATYLFLRTNNIDNSGRSTEIGMLSALEKEVKSFFKNKIYFSSDLISWRGDKISIAKVILSEFVEEFFLFLNRMATDEDETIRWAAIVLAFDFEKRAEYYAWMTNRENDKQDRNHTDKIICYKIRKAISQIILFAFDTSDCYWLQRELLAMFYKEHFENSPVDHKLRIQYSDLRELFKRIESQPDIHQEVKIQLDRLKEKQKRVLLVLPPLHIDGSSPVSKSTSPPLGLAALSVPLLEKGHKVDLIDCHRYAVHVPFLIDNCDNYDFIAFSVVSSTFLATQDLISRMLIACNQKNMPMPKIVIGGHAASLHPTDFLANKNLHWDYLVMGDGEVPLLNIVMNSVAGVPGIIANNRVHQGNNAVHYSKYFQDDFSWNKQQWIDRRLFTAPDSTLYEPVNSRNNQFKEAHVVMSKGCSWKCSFCTEAILRGSAGEIRRDPRDVVAEITYLMEEFGVNRIQFIDDNLLPQIGYKRTLAKSDNGFHWADILLTELEKIKQRNNLFSWRGIMRFEDYSVYNELHKYLFQERLAQAGCNLLAFGVESGNEKKRSELKGGSVSNNEIIGIISGLRDVNILSKGYFIIGGENETSETSEESLSLATNAPFALAYFSLYKNFRKLISESSKSNNPYSLREKKYFNYQTLESNLDEEILSIIPDRDSTHVFGKTYSNAEILQSKQIIEELEFLGFKFSDLFKYNDFHEYINEYNSDLRVWASSDLNPQRSFINAVKHCYYRFYIRRKFVEDYKTLLGLGY